LVGLRLEPGAVIAGRYRLERVLGQGGMGTVWAATHMVTRRDVAVKLVRGSAQARPSLRRRLLREARAASAVDHPNVVEVLDAFELDDETPVMVMERLRGETLAQRIARDEVLSLAETAALMVPVASAIGAAHAKGVVHRDLKPDNIFLAEIDGALEVRVLDFGIAKLAEPIADGQPATQTGATVGTPCYMAPEQALGEKEIDHRADIWAMGVMVYECLTGARPIEGDSVGQIVMHLMTTGITPAERLVELPDDVASLIGRMLSREREARLGDVHEVKAVLEKHADVRAVDFTPRPSRRARRRPAALYLGGAVLVAAAAVFLAKRSEPSAMAEGEVATRALATEVVRAPKPSPALSATASESSAAQSVVAPPSAVRRAPAPRPRPVAPAPLAGLAEEPPF
jgi:eukaryotic-like serine/threonine-protein kinase